jgi:hypothetical protein
MGMTRGQFLQATAVGAAALAWLGACGDDDDGATADASPGPDVADTPDAAPPSCTGHGAGASGTQIFGNHGHKLVIPVADVNAASMDRTYSIQGVAAHDHLVVITAADFDKLKQNMSGVVMETSDSDGSHTHVVTVFCV